MFRLIRRATQRGFTLIETIIALAIVGTAVIAVVAAIGQGAKASARGRESVVLLQLARAQIETIQQYPYQTNPANYPLISPVPDGYSVSFTSTDPGTTYTYPSPAPTVITGPVQQISVTTTGDFGEMEITFYKVRVP